jgi:energy-coupling factor transporter ATP-binding protein EcfA2
MQLHIRGVVGIDAATVEVNKIALLVGQTGAGKSTIADAARAALTRDPMVRGLKAKNALSGVVRGGHPKGTVSLSTDSDNAVGIVYPAGTVETTGSPPHAHPIVAGSYSVFGLSMKNRAEIIGELIRALPTPEDVHKAVTGLEVADPGKIAAAVNAKIAEQGWDGAYQHARDRGIQLKGQWEGVTSERYGSAKAAQWIPDGWGGDLEEASLDALQKALADAQNARDDLIRHQGQDEGVLEATRELARKRDGHAKKLVELEAQLPSFERRLKESQDALAALPEAEENKVVLDCPHCGASSYLVIDRKNQAVTEYRLDKDAQVLSPEAKKMRRQARMEAEEAVKVDRQGLETHQSEIRYVEKLMAEAMSAAAKLKSMEANWGTATEEQINKAKQDVEEAQQRLGAYRKMHDAHRAHRAIEMNHKIIDILAPQGLRKTVLWRRLELFNEKLLKPIYEAWGAIAAVTIDETFEAQLGSRYYSLLSRGEQLIVDTVFQVAFAKATKAPMVVIDNVDAIDEKLRGGLFKMLVKANLHAIVCVATAVPEKVPNLGKGPYGKTYLVAGAGVKEM